MDALGYDQTLAALMGRIGQRVRVSVFSGREDTHAHVVDVEGTLTAGWDPDVLRDNGVGDAAIFRMADVDGFTLYLLREDFADAQEDADRLLIRTGGIAVAVGPPFIGE